MALFTLLFTLLTAAFGQTNLTVTTLASAVTASDKTVNLTSATGVSARTIETVTVIYIDREAMRVTTVASTIVGVERGAEGTVITSHASGSRVYIGAPGAFSTSSLAGPCTASEQRYHPRIVVNTGEILSCADSRWQSYTGSPNNLGTPNTGVTAYEIGDDRRHVTKLSFTDLAIGSAAGAALGIGKLLYTLPAGAVVVKSSYYGVALAGSGSGCDANTPVGGLGTVIASGAVSVLSGTATFQDIMAGATYADVNGTTKVNTVGTVLAIAAASAHTVHFNLAVTWSGTCDVTGTGTVVIEWVLLQ